MKEKILCPLNLKVTAELERTISAEFIINKYQKSIGISIDRLFDNIQEVGLYRCSDTGFRFYRPSTISGDAQLYADLQNFEWYYKPWKWEHQQVFSEITDGNKILEVGAGDGSFIRKINDKFLVHTLGLELNTVAVREAQEKGLNLINQSIEEHGDKNADTYDVVCSFQVLEHIAEVHDFIEAMKKCLKPGGKLFIGVPNNQSFVKHDWQRDFLNLPPHHMSLWDPTSLVSLSGIFDLKLLDMKFEPLQPYHFDWYINNLLFKYSGRVVSNVLIKTGIYKIFRGIMPKVAQGIHGHSVLAVYQKVI
ncbi:MAG: class I SAM-dependent methyltransferase [Bacteroidia bacterium]